MIDSNLAGNIPAELRALNQWVCSDANGKPINPTNGRNAKSNDPRTWAPFPDAIAACEKYGHEFVALALTAADPYCVVDLDNKETKPANVDMLALFGTIREGLDSYTERSRSGRGWHIVVKAELAAPLKTSHIEIYGDAHFMTFTGDVAGKPKRIRERSDRLATIVAKFRPVAPASCVLAPTTDVMERPDIEVIELAAQVPLLAAKFSALHAGDWEANYSSQSEADLAYFGMLWNASGAEEQVKRLWLLSPLAQREKGQRPDYITRMLAKVTKSEPKLYRDDDPASLFSDTANARRIVHHMGAWLLFVPGIGWHVWDGVRWRCDALEARRHVSRLGRIVMNEANDILQQASAIPDAERAERERKLAIALLKFAGQAENVAKIDAAMKAAEPLLRCEADQLDADPWQLGCANGVLDLRTGELLAPDPVRLVTKSTGVAFDATATAPVFEAFLQRIFRGHPEVPAFLQRLAGFWLTGKTDPALLTVLYGVGANGKSTLVSALQAAMGEYASAAPPGLLIARYGERHPTEFAALQGQRFVVAAESGEGGRLDEEKVKFLTGSDTISARRMREDFYTFRPTHKVAMMTNHKPVVRGTDEGIWRRLLLVPFDEVIPASERDASLGQRLQDEAPGILRWALEGCLAWQRDELSAPAVVAEATKIYRGENDVLAEFLDDQCISEKGRQATSRDLYACYKGWAEDNGERPMTMRTFALRLQERNYVKSKDRRGNRGWAGLALRDSVERPRKY